MKKKINNMNEPKITIQKPCYMKWSELNKIENSRNRYCSECSIHIIDFTQMNNEEIINYLNAGHKEKVCVTMFSENESSLAFNIQKKVLYWHENLKSKLKNGYLKSAALFLIGLLLNISGCIKAVGEPAPPCRDELIPDTTTVEPNDSIIVEICE